MNLPIRLGRMQELFVYLVGAVLTLSGVIWVYFHYFIRVEGEFGELHHPAEPVMLTIHGLSAALMMIAFGTVIPGHVTRAWAMRRNIVTGVSILSFMIFLSGTGYFLYYLSDEQIRAVTAVSHWGLGLAFPFLGVVHIWRGYLSRKNN